MPKHYVSNADQSVRMFRSNLLEAFSHIHPAVPHVIFIPVVAAMLWSGYQAGLSAGWQVSLFVGGMFIWTGTEYIVHRFVFHAPERVEQQVRETAARLPTGEPVLPALKGLRDTFYFIAHGVHHDFPNDSKRLVMAPPISIPLALLFYGTFRGLFGSGLTPPLFAGFISGYLVYDTVHYAVHHFSLKNPVLLYLKKLHFRHHYGDSTKDFGVSSPLWDVVWGTLSRGAVEEPPR